MYRVQAIRGQAHEASIGFASNATAFGEAWAGTHLRSWRRHLERKCSGIGMSEIIEGAERQDNSYLGQSSIFHPPQEAFWERSVAAILDSGSPQNGRLVRDSPLTC